MSAGRQHPRQERRRRTHGQGQVYKQLEMGLSDAYEYAGEVMACNMMSEDAG